MSDKVNIAAVLVLYEEHLEETKTFQSILTDCPWPLLVYDNSAEPQVITSDAMHTYVHDASNPGVSKAYNHSIAWAKGLGLSHLLLLDSDSSFPAEAITVYEDHAQEYPDELILPSLFSEQKRISPFYFSSGKSHYGAGIAYGKLRLGSILAINSGALLPLHQIGDMTYDELLPLDWSDVQFFRQLAAAQFKAQHVPLEVQHGLSEHTKRSIASAQFRYSLYRAGITRVARGRVEHLLMLFWAKLKALKLCWLYRSPWFLAEYFRKFYV